MMDRDCFRACGPLLFALTAIGCFTYNDVPRTEAFPGREIRVELNADGRTALANQIGQQVRSLTGRLDAVDTAGLTIAIAKTTVMSGDDNGWHGESVVIPYQYISHTEERTLSKGKTVALAALAAGALSGIVIAIGHGSGLTSASSTGPGSVK